jgi:hypothetical protein
MGVVAPVCKTMPSENMAGNLTSARAGEYQIPIVSAVKPIAEMIRRIEELLVAILKAGIEQVGKIVSQGNANATVGNNMMARSENMCLRNESQPRTNKEMNESAAKLLEVFTTPSPFISLVQTRPPEKRGFLIICCRIAVLTTF